MAVLLSVLTVMIWIWLWLVVVLMGAAIGAFFYFLITETWHAFRRKRITNHDPYTGPFA